MTPHGSFWIVATPTADGLLYERLDQAAHARHCRISLSQITALILKLRDTPPADRALPLTLPLGQSVW